MTALRKSRFISVDEYLAGELVAESKHEYFAGTVYAMAGAKIAHNRVAMNGTIAVGRRLLGKPCQPYNSDTKIRINSGNFTRFYYPDLSVVCESNPGEDTYQDRPVVVCEVVSPGTRRIDWNEKRDGYLSLPSLQVYLLVEYQSPQVTLFRRVNNEFIQEDYDGLEAIIPLPEIGVALPLAELYEGIEFGSLPTDDGEENR